MDAGRFTLGAFIGKGASGEVYEGFDPMTGCRLAIKCVDCRRFRSLEDLAAVQEEIVLLRSLRHRYIVRLIEAQVTASHILLAMEHAGGGTLHQLLRAQVAARGMQESGALSEAQALHIFLQIFQAVDYCHRRRVVHRDLKPENILLDGRGDVKVADFGLASILAPCDGGTVNNVAGTPEFMAPDLLVSICCDGVKADLWSLGVMLYESLAGRLPFTGPSVAAILRAALKNEYAPLPASISSECRDLVACLLCRDPGRRATLEQVLSHPWIVGRLERGRQLSPVPSSGDKAGAKVEAAEGQEEAEEGHEGGQAGQRGNSRQPAVAAGRPGSTAAQSRAEGEDGGRWRAQRYGGPAFRTSIRGITMQCDNQSQGDSPLPQRSSLILHLPNVVEQALPPVAEDHCCCSLAGLAIAEGSTSGNREQMAAAPNCQDRSLAAPGKSAASLSRRPTFTSSGHAGQPSSNRLRKSLSSSSLKATAAACSAEVSASSRPSSASRPGSRGRA